MAAHSLGIPCVSVDNHTGFAIRWPVFRCICEFTLGWQASLCGGGFTSRGSALWPCFIRVRRAGITAASMYCFETVLPGCDPAEGDHILFMAEANSANEWRCLPAGYPNISSPTDAMGVSCR